MPSASSKSEKPASSEAVEPLRQAITILEHKIRNLEKRKARLATYKDSVKTLSRDQTEALSKYDEVLHQLDLSKDYLKQFHTLNNETAKMKKKNARKEAQEKFIAEAKKVKQVLLIQDVLQNMGGHTAREDFLTGKNGATLLTQADIKTLDDLYSLLTPSPMSGENTTPKIDQLQKISEYYMAIVEGKQKELAGMSCAKLRELLTSIYSSGYFDKPLKDTSAMAEQHTCENPIHEEAAFRKPQEILSNVIVPSQNLPEGNMSQVQNQQPIQPVLQGSSMLPAGNQPPLMTANPPQMMPPNVANIVPTPVSQVESSYFNAQGVKPRPPQTAVPPAQTRQINEVIQSVTGKFNFLRESELELPEMGPSVLPANSSNAAPQMPAPVPAGIPTRTFTNQNFNGQPTAAPSFPPAYPPQPATFQTYVPAFPAFVGPNNSPTTNNNINSTNSNSNNINNTNRNPNNIAVNTTTAATSTTIDNMKINNGSNILNNGNINTTANKMNSSHGSSMSKNMPNPIPMSTNRNPNMTFNQGQQQIPTGLSMQYVTQAGSQPPNQPSFQNVNVAPPNTISGAQIDDTVHTESEKKDKKEIHPQDWSQQDNPSWTTGSDWNTDYSKNGRQNEGTTIQNKFPSGRVNKNGASGPRNANGYQGNRNRINRQGGYREQNNQGGYTNFYQNQNGYQPRSDRNNEYAGKQNSDFRDNTFKERGDFSNRDNYGGGFKRGPNNRGPNMKGPMDRGDRMGQFPRNNGGGPRPPRNINRQPNLGNGPSYQRQQPNQGAQLK